MNFDELRADFGVRYYQIIKELINVAYDYIEDNKDNYVSENSNSKYLVDDAAKSAIDNFRLDLSQYDALVIIWFTTGLTKSVYVNANTYEDCPMGQLKEIIKHAITPVCEKCYHIPINGTGTNE